MTAGPHRSRVIDIDRAAMTPKQDQVLERLDAGRGWVPTPYKVWIHAPEIAEGIGGGPR
jgi:4-carboxymuconolactone decarboxylase